MPRRNKPDIIVTPPGTRLYAVVLDGDDTHIWIAVGKRGDSYSEWQGTYLRLEPNGRVTRVTRDDNYDVDAEMIIREGD